MGPLFVGQLCCLSRSVATRCGFRRACDSPTPDVAARRCTRQSTGRLPRGSARCFRIAAARPTMILPAAGLYWLEGAETCGGAADARLSASGPSTGCLDNAAFTGRVSVVCASRGFAQTKDPGSAKRQGSCAGATRRSPIYAARDSFRHCIGIPMCRRRWRKARSQS